MLKECAAIWSEVRNMTPLVHCITNYVTVKDVANSLLASGASPAMVENPLETEAFAAISQAVYFNLGTLTFEQERAMLEGMKGAQNHNKPVVVDPVACGVIPRKAEVLQMLAQVGRITCIKGNGAEIKSLLGVEARARGVDSLDRGEEMEKICRELAIREKAVIAATGEVDTISDGRRLFRVFNGTDMFAAITGAGCMVGALVAACIGIHPRDPWLAAAAAICAYNIAGERAAQKSGLHPGTFNYLLFDELFHLDNPGIIKEGKVQWQA